MNERWRTWLHDQLRLYFGYTAFRPGQLEIMERIWQRKNVLGLLATGGGKSITYQLPALCLPGTAVVVSPLISLMVDQVQQLRGKRRIPAAYVNSMLEPAEARELLAEIASGVCKMVYVSPEKLQSPALQMALRRAGVSMVAVDEAHCISQWGHDFRTDYLRLPEVIKQLGTPPVLAVTATAAPGVREEICRLLQIEPGDVVAQPLNRGNIAMDIIPVKSEEERRRLVAKAIEELEGPGIVYCGTRQAVEALAAECQIAGKKRVHGYHGGMSGMDRMVVQTQFLRDELDVIVATNAFGMGIDKPDIRYVLHYHFPPSLEAYAQEIGRVGRDGQAGYAGLYYAPEDRLIHAHLQGKEYPTEEQLHRFLQLLSSQGLISLQELLLADIPEEMAGLLFFYAEQAGCVSDVSTGRDHIRYAFAEASRSARQETAAAMMRAMETPKRQKRKKLIDMLSWLEGAGCFRERLNRYFGETDRSFSHACCTYCGLDPSAFKRVGTPASGQTNKTEWNLRKALENLLPNKKGGSVC
ncbi:ATP-dependent DNA helicase RecQ [Brevibacillus composti]|uniref:ATP-dependent DNA helicase RecQ n=1 Tax=Brevibacillus composti TaxID=2796470 RepID=A0A7T5EHM6_9BACL|nr:ATP-dependent DNA helicase RecQ [Brevibacillus composti]QQE72789.1 ATP-dependent DNA helicase RecQ [Brevibacillus composti]QUO39868.1 ATP-dependent DNA helicase RecQ [Brevibacillus composti]